MTDAELLTLYDDAAPLLDGHLAGLRAVERAARAAEREACIAEADATAEMLAALYRTTKDFEDANVLRGAELVADALREALGDER